MKLTNHYEPVFKVLNSYTEIPRQEWDKVKELFSLKEYSRGQKLIMSGEKSDFMGFILKGMTRSYYVAKNGSEYNQVFRKEGDVIMSYYTILADIPSLSTIQTIEKTTMLVGNFSEFQPFVEQHVCWNNLARELAEKNYLETSFRERSLLIHKAKERYAHFFKHNPEIASRISQRQLALYIGVDPSSLNRIIKEFDL